MRVPMDQFSERLDGADHARHDVVAVEQAADLGLDARGGAGGQLAQQRSVEAGVQSQPFGDRQHDLTVSDGKTDVFGRVNGDEQRTLLVAGWADATLLAGKGHKHLVLTVPAANAREAVVHIAAPEIGLHRPLHHRPPEAILRAVKGKIIEGRILNPKDGTRNEVPPLLAAVQPCASRLPESAWNADHANRGHLRAGPDSAIMASSTQGKW
jgi:hypothetical protein